MTKDPAVTMMAAMVGDNLNPPTARVMLDLETWGTKPGSVIVSIAAVRFDSLEVLRTAPRFYAAVEAQSCLDAGLKVDAGTLYWWFGQAPEAQDAMCGRELNYQREDLAPALQRLNLWLPKDQGSWQLWCNGANFDEPLLTAAWEAVRGPVPWRYGQVRCFRTLKHLAGSLPGERVLEPVRAGTHHNALDDAVHQAGWALGLLGKLGRGCYSAP